MAEETAIVGKQLTAEFYAKIQLGELFPIGVDPWLLNAAKAEKLRQKNLGRPRWRGAISTAMIKRNMMLLAICLL